MEKEAESPGQGRKALRFIAILSVLLLVLCAGGIGILAYFEDVEERRLEEEARLAQQAVEQLKERYGEDYRTRNIVEEDTRYSRTVRRVTYRVLGSRLMEDGNHERLRHLDPPNTAHIAVEVEIENNSEYPVEATCFLLWTARGPGKIEDRWVLSPEFPCGLDESGDLKTVLPGETSRGFRLFQIESYAFMRLRWVAKIDDGEESVTIEPEVPMPRS